MGTNDESKPSKSDKPASPTTPEQTRVHVYPDWAAMQAYYGPRVAIPPYYGASVSSGHAPPPYMWGPQPMIPPYGTPYPAVYPHAGVYGHPAAPVTIPPVAVETPKKPLVSTEGGLRKKLKSFDGLAMSIGNGKVDSGDAEVDQSTETEGSSYGDRSREEKAGRKRSSEGINSTGDAKTEAKTPEVGDTVDSPISGKLPPVRASSFEVKNPVSSMDVKKAVTSSMQPGPIVPSENERELKRERRKQSNRESARRSRLRKQAEAEELARKVESLMAENMALKSEISRLTESSEKLRVENSSLMDKLGSVQRAEEGREAIGKMMDDEDHPSDNTENFLSRINSGREMQGRNEGEAELLERKSKKDAKLHQLLDSKSRTDAVAAS
ncbi:hypothetical protein MLD38_018255 [Melastoma candidum]|uniref:Uncharacterized protein n=1 Tax=Melastoma candidum TaxID=119954 RepID=A0ACB9QTE6_9MYRT|nr:hypothetical protein MLD38_018255 [Melastoma candidum]